MYSSPGEITQWCYLRHFFAIFNMRLLLLNITIVIIIVVFVVNIILCTAFTSLILNK